MTDGAAQGQAWANTTAGIIVINGVITAVVSSLVTWLISNASSVPWPGLIPYIPVIALATLLVASAITRNGRRIIWGSIGRFLRMLPSLRVTRKAVLVRYEELSNSFEQSEEAGERLNKSLNFTVQERARLAESVRMLEAEVADLQEKQQQAETSSLSPSVQPSIPLPQPRWRIYEDDADGREFIIRNVVDRSIAREVRVDAPNWAFEFEDAGHWENLSGVATDGFRGTMSGLAERSGFAFELTWYDEHGDRQSESIDIAPTNPPSPEDSWVNSPF